MRKAGELERKEIDRRDENDGDRRAEDDGDRRVDRPASWRDRRTEG